MFKRMNLIAATALCGLTLSLLTAPGAHADPKLIAQARAAAELTVNVVLDTDQGSRLNNQAAQSVQTQLAGSDWSILDNGQAIVAKGDKRVLGPLAVFTNSDHDFFLLHSRSPKLSVDGTIRRWGDDLKEGFAELFVAQLANDGRTWVTFNLQVPLTFATAGGSSGGDSGGGFGGFGG
jgi:hypothetical protein